MGIQICLRKPGQIVWAEREHHLQAGNSRCSRRGIGNTRSADNFQTKQIPEHCVRGKAGDKSDSDGERNRQFQNPERTQKYQVTAKSDSGAQRLKETDEIHLAK
jgi:hypothetical protein